MENDTNWDWFVRHLTNNLVLGDDKGYAILFDKQKVSVWFFKASHCFHGLLVILNCLNLVIGRV